MIKKLMATWHFVRAGDSLSLGDHVSAFQHMQKAKSLAGSAYHKTSLFEMNMRMALAAKFCDERAIALDEANKAKAKIETVDSINEPEKKYLIMFCDLIESECGGGDFHLLYNYKTIEEISKDSAIKKRFIDSYPIKT